MVMAPQIHATALVAPGAEIAADVRIGPYCVVDGRVRIGKGSVLHAFVRLCDFVEVGEGCELCEHVTLGREPQDFGFRHEESWVRIGSGVVLRENVTVHRATGEGNATRVGDGAYLMEGVHVGHNVQVGPGVVMASKAGIAGYVEIGEKTVVGGMVGIHQFVKVGRYCMLGGASKIVRDVPPFALVDGRPARMFGINKVGLRRHGFGGEARRHVLSLYQSLYQSGLPLRQALEKIKASLTPEDALGREIVAFAEGARRGLVPWGRRHDGGDHD